MLRKYGQFITQIHPTSFLIQNQSKYQQNRIGLLPPKMNPNLVYIASFLLLLQSTHTLAQKDSTLYHLHHLFADDRYTYQRSGSGIGFFSAIIISIVAGVLCFLGIMYFLKYRREGSVTLPFFGTIGNRNPTHPQQPVNAHYNAPHNAPPAYPQHQPTYGGNPYESNNYYQPGQHPYNPNNPQYPAL